MPAAVLLTLGALLIFGSFALALSTIGVATRERRAVSRSLAAIRAIDSAPEVLRQELEQPFAERVIAPLGDQLINLGKALTRSDTASRLQHKLDIAGNPPAWTVERIIGLKVLATAIIGGMGGFWALGREMPLPQDALIIAGMGALGYLLPNILLHNAGQKRENEMLRALPDALDLMTISVEAGLGFDSAVQRVARDTEGPLAQEFARVLQEMQIGVGRMEALRAMADRTTIRDLKSFALAMVQADSFGIPIARVLRVQAKEMRVKRRQRAEEKAQKVPVKILFPLIFFILPCLFIVVMGPAVIQMMDIFGSVETTTP